eukprot:3180963-Prymnesium_polylepis.1
MRSGNGTVDKRTPRSIGTHQPSWARPLAGRCHAPTAGVSSPSAAADGARHGARGARARPALEGRMHRQLGRHDEAALPQSLAQHRPAARAAEAEFRKTDTSRWPLRPLADGSQPACGKCGGPMVLRASPGDHGGGKGGGGKGGGGKGGGGKGGGGKGSGGGRGDGGRPEQRVLHCGRCSEDHWLPGSGDLSRYGARCPLCNFEVLT